MPLLSLPPWRPLLPPPQVIPDGSGKKRVFLKHHGYGIPQMPQRIFLHRMPVDADLSLCTSYRRGNQLHQRGFGSAGSSDDADCLAGLHMKRNVRKHIFLRIFAVFKGYTWSKSISPFSTKCPFDRSSVMSIFVHYLRDTLPGGEGSGEHHKYIGYHHQGN